MKNNYSIKHLYKIPVQFANILFVFIFLTQLQSLANDDLFVDYITVPKSVVNYAKRHNLQLEVDKYEIEKDDITNGDKYKYIYPCSTKDGKAYAILYKNMFFIKIAEPKARYIRYFGTR